MNLNISRRNPEHSLNILMVDIGDISKVIGYTFKIIDFLGRVVFESIINQQIFDLDLNALGGRGTYIIELVDNSSRILEVEKIVLH